MEDSASRREGMGAQGAATRAAIAEIAQAMFTEHGYLGTSVRAIASSVGVDAALVIRYFGSKERLFLETVHMPSFIERSLDGPMETLGERIIGSLFAGDLENRVNVHVALLRASDTDSIREAISRTRDVTFTGPLERHLGGPDARLRARLIGAQVNGLLTALAMDDDVLASEDHRKALTELYGRAVQALIDT